MDQQAKAHMEETLRMNLEEKEHTITALQTQVKYMFILYRVVFVTIFLNLGSASKDVVDF